MVCGWLRCSVLKLLGYCALSTLYILIISYLHIILLCPHIAAFTPLFFTAVFITTSFVTVVVATGGTICSLDFGFRGFLGLLYWTG